MKTRTATEQSVREEQQAKTGRAERAWERYREHRLGRRIAAAAFLMLAALLTLGAADGCGGENEGFTGAVKRQCERTATDNPFHSLICSPAMANAAEGTDRALDQISNASDDRN